MRKLSLKLGFKKKKVSFVPISAQSGENVAKPIEKASETAPWYKGPSLISINGAMMAIGKVEFGTLNVGDTVLISPRRVLTRVAALAIDDVPCDRAPAGENVVIIFDGKMNSKLSTDGFQAGSILSSAEHPSFSSENSLPI